VQRTLAQSSKLVIEDTIETRKVRGFRVLTDHIISPGNGLILFQGMQDHTAESIKSLEGMDCAWTEEAQTMSKRSLTLLRPTIRAPGSELWFSWNGRRKQDAVDEFLVANKPDNAIVVKANWRDNPWFTPELEAERLLDLEKYPDQYPHVWEGEYVQIIEGAYYAQMLKDAEREGRICNVSRDPIMQLRAIWDIGGPSKRADAMAITLAQYVDREIRVLDYIEGVGQVLGYYINELRAKGFGQALCVLPHDGVATHADNPSGRSVEDQLKQAGFSTKVIKNQGAGAAMQRVAVARRMFPRIWFNKTTTGPLRDALGWYHEKRDEDRNVGLGPEHDWSSNGSDSFGLMCVDYEEPRKTIEAPLQPRVSIV
jgi:phage terminase large subunit